MKSFSHIFRYINILYLVACSLCLFLSSCSSYHVIHITDNNKENIAEKNGYYYSLPHTVLKIDVTLKHSYLYKGPFADYAEKYLGITNVIKADAEKYEITDVRINSFPQPDPDQYYFIKKARSLSKSRPLNISFNNEGMIQSINYHSKKSGPEKIIKLTGHDLSSSSSGSRYIFSDNLSEKIDTIVEKIKSDTMVIEKQIFRKVYTGKSSEEKAREAAEYLIKLKDNKFNLITGFSDVPYSEATLKYMKNQLSAEEQKYLSQFTGDTSFVTEKYSFIYLPQKSEISKESALFVFSAKDGILKNPDIHGEVVAISVDKKDFTGKLDKFQGLKDTKQNKKKGFYYRVPEYAKITIRKNRNVLAEDELLISQFGVISNLPRNIKRILFNSNLGSIKTIQD